MCEPINETEIPFFTRPASIPPLDTRIDVDLPCVRCGYNLRSRLVGDRCSECGTAVLAALDRPRLCYDLEIWIIPMRRGIHLVYYGGIVAGASFLINVCLDAMLIQSSFKSTMLGSFASILVAGIVAHFVGAWIIVTPHVYQKKREAVARMVIRLNMLTLGAALCLGTIVLIFKPKVGWVSIGLQAVVVLSCCIHGVVLAGLLSGIERRCADPRAGRLSLWKWIRKALILATVMYIVVGASTIARDKWDWGKPIADTTISAVFGLTALGVVVLAIITRRTTRMIEGEWRACRSLALWSEGDLRRRKRSGALCGRS